MTDAGADDAVALARACACAHQDPSNRFSFAANYIAETERVGRGPQARCRDVHAQAVRYRTEQYGYHPGFGRSEWNAHAPPFYVRDTTFMGLPP